MIGALKPLRWSTGSTELGRFDLELVTDSASSGS